MNILRKKMIEKHENFKKNIELTFKFSPDILDILYFVLLFF